jgi:hypothetical protein
MNTSPEALAAAPVPAAGAPSGSTDRSTHFVFDNKVFTLDRAYFSLAHDTKEPIFHVMLGTLNAALPLPTLRMEFSIDPESPDGKLLDIIEKSLRYVKEIRPNDSIPRELLDGSASWSVDTKHQAIAQQRLIVQLASWLTGEEKIISDVSELEQLAEDPATKQRMQNAINEIAERIGIGKDRRQEVVDKINDFTRELSYIEALRERFGFAKGIALILSKLSKLYSSDRTITEEIVRILQLLRPPLADFDQTFSVVDAQTSEILNILQMYDKQVTFVRQMRDDLSFRLRIWDDLIEKWNNHQANLRPGQGLARSPEAEALLKETYRFAAQNFLHAQNWRR